MLAVARQQNLIIHDLSAAHVRSAKMATFEDWKRTIDPLLQGIDRYAFTCISLLCGMKEVHGYAI